MKNRNGQIQIQMKKMAQIFNHQEHANQNKNEISSHTTETGINHKEQQAILR